jgi:hypothetical protein
MIQALRACPLAGISRIVESFARCFTLKLWVIHDEGYKETKIGGNNL